MSRIALIANPGSGSGDAEQVEALLAEAGAEVATFPLADPGAAAEASPARVVVAGGDGTIGPAAAVAAMLGVPLAVVATGTANDFARHLGLPLDLEAACLLAANGTETRRVELARVGGRPFVNVAGCGLPPAAAAAAREMKDSLGPLAYPVGAVRAGATRSPLRCTARVDGRTAFDGEAWQASVAASGAFGAGSTFRADPGDGRLDLIVIEGGSRARLVKHAFGLRLGAVEDQAGVVSARGEAIELSLDPGEELNIDGELVLAADLDRDGRLRFAADGGFDLVVG
jgi:diacylglycerol kinase family enzyme